MRTTEGIVLAGQIWAETGDKSSPSFPISGGYPVTMSTPVTFAILAGGTITATVGDFIALAATAFGKCTVDGITAEFNLDFTTVTTFDNIATEFQTKMVAAGLPVTVVFDVGTTTLLIRSNTAGVSSTLSFFVTPSTGVNIAPIARLTLADGATTTQGQGEFPPRDVFNNNQNINTSLAFDVNRYGANLTWDETILYEIGAVVIGSDNSRYQALRQNINANPVIDDSNTITIAAGQNFQGIDVQPSGDIIAATGTGSVFKSIDNGLTFTLQHSETFTTFEGRSGFVIVFDQTIIVPEFNGSIIDSLQVSSDEGDNYSSAGNFFNVSELDLDVTQFIITGARAGNGQESSNNSNFKAVGVGLIGTKVHAILLDLDTPTARIIDTTIDVSVTQSGILRDFSYFLDNNDFYLIFNDTALNFTVKVFDITNTSTTSGSLEEFNITTVTRTFNGFFSKSPFSNVITDLSGSKYLFVSGENISTIQLFYFRIDITQSLPINWVFETIGLSNSNLPIILKDAPLPDPYLSNGEFIYFIYGASITGLPSDAPILRANINTRVNLNYTWEYFNAENNNFEDNDGRVYFTTTNNDTIYFLNGGNNNQNQVTDPREFLSILGATSQDWQILNGADLRLESSTNSLTVNEDNITNRTDINVAPSLLSRLLALGTAFEKQITIPETSDILLVSIISQINTTESLNIVYDFANDQLRLDNTGTTDNVSLFFNNDGVTSTNGNMPFRIWYDPNPTDTEDRQIIAFGASGFFTASSTANSNQSYVGQNSRSKITGNFIFTNSGEIVEYEIDIININGTLVNVFGVFKFI